MVRERNSDFKCHREDAPHVFQLLWSAAIVASMRIEHEGTAPWIPVQKQENSRREGCRTSACNVPQRRSTNCQGESDKIASVKLCNATSSWTTAQLIPSLPIQTTRNQLHRSPPTNATFPSQLTLPPMTRPLFPATYTMMIHGPSLSTAMVTYNHHLGIDSITPARRDRSGSPAFHISL